MKSVLFIIIVLLSGCIAGIIHGITNLVLVEPYLDEAIKIENRNLFATGEAKDSPEFWINYYSYRDWQKGGQVLAGTILGTSIGALFGIIFAYSKNSLPRGSNIKKALVLAGLMWLSIFFIPFLKYPANPPTIGEPETVVLRETMYLSIMAISGLGMLGFYHLYKKTNKKLVGIIGYAVFISSVFIIMPDSPDEITAPLNLVNEFRIASALAVTVFWISLAVVFGIFWEKFYPDQKLKRKSFRTFS